MTTKGRFKSLLLNLTLLTVVTLLTLLVLDVVLIATGLLPPVYDYGDPRVGWVAAHPTGVMVEEGCRDLESGRRLSFQRNEDGVRTSFSAVELRGPGPRLEMVVGGDSHTDLCAPNDSVHFGVTQRALDSAGIPSASVAFGSGKYSPLQAYLALTPSIAAYRPQALILNLYTGNDFYDMLRVDDRPHYVASGVGYRIADPVWFQHDPPGVKRRSRVLHAFRLLADATGARRVVLRLRYLRQAAAQQGQGIGAVVGYINDLRKATAKDVGYPQAFAAQMLNQQIFFHRFPGSREESVRRITFLLQRIRAEHPDLLLVLSPIPSYQLVLEFPTDSTFAAVVDRLPVSFVDGVREEGELYAALRGLADATGWSFVDNLQVLRQFPDRGALYNHFDYHIQPVASDAIGRGQAASIAAWWRARNPVVTARAPRRP